MFREVIIGRKQIIALHQISISQKYHVVECIDGGKYSKDMCMETLTTVIARPLSNGGDYANVEN